MYRKFNKKYPQKKYLTNKYYFIGIRKQLYKNMDRLSGDIAGPKIMCLILNYK